MTVVLERPPDIEPLPPEAQTERRVRGLRPEEWVEYTVAFAAGLHLALLVRFVLDWDGLLSSAMVTILAFIGVHYLIVRERSTPELAVDTAMTTVMWTVGAAIIAVLVWMTSYVVVRGYHKLSWSFFTDDFAEVGALDDGGGALHAIIGSAQQVGLAACFVVPVAVLTAVYLHEIRGRLSGLVRFVIDSLAGLPSIVAGLLIFTIWPGYSGVRASAALTILALPIVTRTAEEVLRTVPDGLREASLALGAPQWRVVGRVVLPTAKAGLVTATLLAIARMVGETAPVLLTAFYSPSINADPFNGPQASLPTLVLQMITQPNKNQNDRAWTAALLLLMIVLTAFGLARIVLARSERRLGRR